MNKKNHDARSLAETITAYTSGGALPMHMPGHKRKTALFPPELAACAALDITEIDGFDNLHQAEGLLLSCEERAARLWGSRRSFFLVNGSTCGILAAVRAATKPGDTVLLARNCHKSVYHAIELCCLRPIYLMPVTDPGTGVAGSIAPGQVEKAFARHPEAALVILTSPTYEGVVSDLGSVSALAHQRGVPVLVDEAHGAHLGFSPDFPREAGNAGADIVVMSLHKTLPALTQTGLVHVFGTLVDDRRVARELSVFETSSPSYILMSSIDACVRLLERDASALFSNYAAALCTFDRAVSKLTRLRALYRGGGLPDGFFGLDRGKIIIETRGAGIGGPALSAMLRGRFGIEVEMSCADYILAMTSICDTEETLLRFADALLLLDREFAECGGGAAPVCFSLEPEIRLPAWEAVHLRGEQVAPSDAEGRTALEYMWAYPPGIPLLVPGEAVSSDLLRLIRRMEEAGVEVSTSSGGTETIMCQYV